MLELLELAPTLVLLPSLMTQILDPADHDHDRELLLTFIIIRNVAGISLAVDRDLAHVAMSKDRGDHKKERDERKGKHCVCTYTLPRGMTGGVSSSRAAKAQVSGVFDVEGMYLLQTTLLVLYLLRFTTGNQETKQVRAGPVTLAVSSRLPRGRGELEADAHINSSALIDYELFLTLSDTDHMELFCPPLPRNQVSQMLESRGSSNFRLDAGSTHRCRPEEENVNIQGSPRSVFRRGKIHCH